MSDSVERKVVEMRFDNKQFEANTKQSMSTLDKLKEKLSFKDTSKGIENVSNSIRKVDFSPLSNAAEKVQLKFSALEVAATTALVNITNSAVNAGKKLVAAFTIDPVKTGFQEYETQINAIQTILANTSSNGTTLDQVNDALDLLNHYADMTIYNFTEMTRNIGTFTAAGVDLDTSVSAIKGIANLAAVSGSTSQQASTAMYQLSQALASGTVKLQDWNSVVNAGMGGQVFQDALKETAKIHGIAIDKMIEDEGSFRETLSNGWLSSEILTETLSKFTGDLTEAQIMSMGYTKEQAAEILKLGETANDAATKVKTFSQLMDTLKEAVQSGWTQSWEILIGDFGQAKEMFTMLSDVFSDIIGKSADARNSLLTKIFDKNWGTIGDGLSKAGISMEKFQNELVATAKTHGKTVDKWIEEDGSFDKTLKRNWLNKDVIIETLDRMAGSLDTTAGIASDLTGDILNLGEAVNKVIRGDFGNGADRVKALTDASYDYQTVQDLVNRTLEGEVINYDELSTEQLKSMGYTNEQAEVLKNLAKQAKETNTPIEDLISGMSKMSSRDMVIETLKNSLRLLTDTLSILRSTWNEVFSADDFARSVRGIIENIYKWSESIHMTSEKADQLRRTFKGLFAILDMVHTLTSGALTIAFKLISKILGIADIDFLEFTALVGDAAVELRDFLFENNAFTKGLETVISRIAEACKQFKIWIDEFLELPMVQACISDFKAMFIDAIQGINSYFAGGADAISAFISRIKSMDNISIDNIGTILKDFKDNVLGYFFDLDGGFSGLKDAFVKFWDNIKSYFGNVTTELTNVKNTIFGFVDSIVDKFGDTALGGILTVGFAVALLKFAQKMKEAFDVLGCIKESVIGVLDSASDALQNYSKSLKTTNILKIAGAIGILAASIVVLSLIPSDKLESSCLAIVKLAAVLVALSALMSIIPKTSMSVAALAAGVLLLTIALKQMEGLEAVKIEGNLKIIAILAAELVGAMAALSIVSAIFSKCCPELKSTALVLVAFSVSLYVLIKALDELSKIDTSDIGKQLLAIGVIFAGMFYIVRASKHVDPKTILGMTSMAITLNIFLKTFSKIAEINFETLIIGAGKFLIVIGLFRLLMRASKNAGQYAVQGGVGVLAMSLAMVVLANAFKTISKIDKKMIADSLLSVSSMLLIFGAIVALSKFAGEHAVKAGAMILMMSGAIAILAGVMWGLSILAKQEGYDKALGSILAMEAMFALLVGISKLATDAHKTLMIMVIAIGVLALSLGLLASLCDGGKLMQAATALSMVMVSMTLMTALSKLAGKATTGMLAVAGLFALVSFALGFLCQFPMDSAIQVAAALSILMVSLSAACILMGKVGVDATAAIVPMVALSLLMFALGVSIGLLEKFDIAPSIETAISIGILANALSVACLLLAAVGATGSAALIGVGVLALVIVAMTGLMALLGFCMENMDGLDKKLDLAIIVFEKIGEAIGAIIGGFAAGLTAGLPTMAQNIADFTDIIVPALAKLKMLDEKVVDATVNLAAALIALTAANLMDGIARFIPGCGNFKTLGEGLVEFGNAMVAFGNVVSVMDDTTITKIVDSAVAARGLADLLETIPPTGGLKQRLCGTVSWDNLSDGLVEFGGALIRYSQSVSELDASKIKAIEDSITASKHLSELLESTPRSGGKLQTLVGSQSWDIFRAGLPEYGVALVTYATSVLDLDQTKVDAIDTSVAASEKLVALLNSMPEANGFKQSMLGEKSWTTFMADLVNFGGQLTAYSVIVGNCHLDAVENSVKAATGLTDVLEAMPATSWLHDAFAGEKSFSKLGESLAEFAGVLRDYGKEVADIDTTPIINSTISLTRLVDVLNGLPTGPMTAKEFASAISLMGNGLGEFGANAAKANPTNLALYVVRLESLLDILKEAGDFNPEDITKFNDGLKKLADVDVVGLSSEFEKASEAVSNVMQSFINGINSSDKIPEMNKAFESMGGYAVQGLINGIDSGVPLAQASIQKLGENILSTFQNTMGIHSPSWITELFGKYTIEGFTNGVDENSGEAKNSITSLGETILGGFNSFKSQFADSGSVLGDVFGGGIMDGAFDSITSLNGLNLESLDSDTSKIFTEAKKEYDALLENYKNGKIEQAEYDKQYTSLLSKYSAVQANLTKYAYEKLLPMAEDEYDNMLVRYKKGIISKSEYDERYTKLLQKYTDIQVDVTKYGQEKITDYVQTTMDNLNKDFEKEISDIQSKMDSFSSKMTTPIDEMITYTTNKDLYDEKLKSYEDQVNKLNEKREKSIEIYGEENTMAQTYQAQIDTLTESCEKYKKEYANSDTKDDEIIDVRFTNKIKQSTRDIQEYTDTVKKLKANNVNEAMIDAIAGMDREKGLATVNYLNSLSDEQLKAVSKNWDKYTAATEDLSEALYGDQIKKATQGYVENVLTTLDSLPESAKLIGVNMISGLTLGFSDETEASLATIGASGEQITDVLKKVFDIHSPSRVFRDEIGANLAAGLSEGFVSHMNTLSAKMHEAVPTDFKISEVNETDIKSFSDAIAKINEIIVNGINTTPTIRPVLDLSNVNNGLKSINNTFGRELAVSTSTRFNDSRTAGMGYANGTTPNASSFTFNQYNNSPKALSPVDVYRNTQHGLQLATIGGVN